MATVMVVVVVAGFLVFFFLVPVVPESWIDGNPHGPFIAFKARASLSFSYLGYGALYNYSVTINGHPGPWNVGGPGLANYTWGWAPIWYSWQSKCPGFPACQ